METLADLFSSIFKKSGAMKQECKVKELLETEYMETNLTSMNVTKKLRGNSKVRDGAVV